jgi:hypothetical protein
LLLVIAGLRLLARPLLRVFPPYTFPNPCFTTAAALLVITQIHRFETAGQAILARVAEVDMSKFADEDQEEEEEPKSYHIKPQVRSGS